MKKLVYIAVGILVDLPGSSYEGDTGPEKESLAEMVARLQREQQGHDAQDPAFLFPGVTIQMLAAYREYPERN